MLGATNRARAKATLILQPPLISLSEDGGHDDDDDDVDNGDHDGHDVQQRQSSKIYIEHTV
jgi:hypothetical protein